ncbi:hypothetical protein [Chelatococcus reniformis]|uniref:Glycosyl hydrolase family 5 n=1 Tax=Chelatococcus reniformis TaxID=1494448 RepID=A0A916XJ03_9HYPH|nr:hypothetical protein [Chelatococcus reniformis]GGC76864.1 hypothetical protein GCM10010994_38990 [Chelatococcus reniformis]
MAFLRGTTLALALIGGALWAGTAAAAPIAPTGFTAPGAGLTAPGEAIQFARWHRRCWWETRRFRHRGRWVSRRVQVCRR